MRRLKKRRQKKRNLRSQKLRTKNQKSQRLKRRNPMKRSQLRSPRWKLPSSQSTSTSRNRTPPTLSQSNLWFRSPSLFLQWPRKLLTSNLLLRQRLRTKQRSSLILTLRQPRRCRASLRERWLKTIKSLRQRDRLPNRLSRSITSSRRMELPQPLRQRLELVELMRQLLHNNLHFLQKRRRSSWKLSSPKPVVKTKLNRRQTWSSRIKML